LSFIKCLKELDPNSKTIHSSITPPTVKKSVPIQEPSTTHPKTDQHDINKTEPLGPKLIKNDDQNSNAFININDDSLKFNTQYESSSSSELNININVVEIPPTVQAQTQTQTAPNSLSSEKLAVTVATPADTTTTNTNTTPTITDPIKIEDINNNVQNSTIAEKNTTSIKEETVLLANETLDSKKPSAGTLFYYKLFLLNFLLNILFGDKK
jgi:hypothetical protein